ITVTLSGGTFAPVLTDGNWPVTGLPGGVSRGTLTRVDSHTVEITLSGNATAPYAGDITNVTVSPSASEYRDSSGGGALSASSGITLRARTAPSVTTGAAGTITATSADIGGEVTSDGHAAVTARGIEYRTAGSPGYTPAPAGTAGTGAFSVILTGLSPVTTYEARAYATNIKGTSYGSPVTFTTRQISNNADLGSLSLSSGALTPAFRLDVLNYSASVDNSVGSITVTAAVYESNASLKINGQTAVSGQATQPVSLNVGVNNIVVEVTAQDGVTVKSYTVAVTRSAPQSGGGGGSYSAPPRTDSTSALTPASGGTVSLNSEASVTIPAGALQGTSSVKVTVQKVSEPSPPPSGFNVLGNIYEFTVGNQTSYNFNEPVALTFTFDPAALAPGQTPSVFYYDESQSRWIDLGGTVSGNKITVMVDHFTKFALIVRQKEAVKKDTASDSEKRLADTAKHWAEKSIRTMEKAGFVSGYPDGSFRPDEIITRGEFLSILVRVLGLKQEAGKVFTDTSSHWARDVISTAYNNGMIIGYGENISGVDDPVTREQMAVMLTAALKLKADQGEGNETFADKASISPWAAPAIGTLVNRGIMSGYPDGTFRPQSPATRAEALTVTVRAFLTENSLK
ncbi:MAG: S-layer homology domain-containing protein, partial [Bacillota bacterium]